MVVPLAAAARAAAEADVSMVRLDALGRPAEEERVATAVVHGIVVLTRMAM